MDTRQFLKALYATIPHGYMEMRLIHQNGYINRFWKPLPMDSISDEGLSRLAKLNSEYHIYHRMAITPGKTAEKHSVMMLPALWLDIDDASQSAYNRLLNMKLYPNIIVHSGGGFHAYWLLDMPVTTDSERAWFEIERTMEGMILAYGDGADRVARDITRILRTPGFYNIKPKYETAPLCRVVFHDDARYRFGLLHRAYAPLGAPAQPKITRRIPRAALNRSLPNRVKTYLESGTGRGSRNNELYYCARAYLDNGYSQMEASNDLSPRAKMDGLKDNEIAATIASAYRNTPNPSASLPSHMRSFMAIEDTVGGGS